MQQRRPTSTTPSASYSDSPDSSLALNSGSADGLPLSSTPGAFPAYVAGAGMSGKFSLPTTQVPVGTVAPALGGGEKMFLTFQPFSPETFPNSRPRPN